jgi:hypothetical protein
LAAVNRYLVFDFFAIFRGAFAPVSFVAMTYLLRFQRHPIVPTGGEAHADTSRKSCLGARNIHASGEGRGPTAVFVTERRSRDGPSKVG